MTQPVEAAHNLGESLQKRLPVIVIFKNRLPTIAPSGDMVEGAGELYAQ